MVNDCYRETADCSRESCANAMCPMLSIFNTKSSSKLLLCPASIACP